MNNHSPDNPSTSSSLQLQIDRMVDGELPPASSRSLLATIEDQPHLWRSLALAYVEAAALSDDLAGIAGAAPDFASTTTIEPSTAAVQKLQPAKPQSSFNKTLLLAMAASFLFAFTLSTAAYWSLHSTAGLPRAELAGGQPGATGPDTPMVKPPQDGALLTADAASQTPSAPQQSDTAKTQSMTLLVEGTDRQLELPVYHTSKLSPAELHKQWFVKPTALNQDFVRQLEQQGHIVTQRTHFRRVWLDDGELLVVPFDEVEVLPVSLNPQFQ